MRPPRERLEPVVLAAALAAAFLLTQPPTVDLVAHDFRAGLFEREGFALWNGHWYAGHHALAYSVLFPPLAALLGPALAGAAGAVAAAAVFEPLARHRFGDRARLGSLWFALGTGAVLFSGRLPFALGLALGLGALLALQRGRHGIAGALALLTGLASPVAALFLVLAAVAHLAAGLWVGERRPAGALVAAAAMGPLLILAVVVPEGGREPFVLSAFLPIPVLAGACLAFLPARERALRVGAVLYAVLATALVVVDTPLGGNAARLGALFAGPVLACAVSRPRLLALGAAPLLYWQLAPALRDTADALRDPAARDAYYRPLVTFLQAAGAQRDRTEVVFTRSHREAAVVAPRFPLARGWERQLDLRHNGLFYERGLTDARYRSWLHANAVRWVALPDARLDYSARDEGALVERAPPYLRPRFRSKHWRVYEVIGAAPLAAARAPARMRLLEHGGDRFTLAVTAPGEAIVRVRWQPYWLLRGGCVERAGDWTRVTVRGPGRVTATTRFSARRVRAEGRRCG